MNQKVIEKFWNLLGKDRVLVDEPMKRHTTFRIGGPADFFLLPSTVDEVRGILEICREEELPYFILGNGSNLLVSDKGYRGVIIQLYRNFSNISVEGNEICASSGAHPLFHSDGGFQYTSPVFVRMLKDNGMEQSMSRVHCCIDNGPMEGFWGILKCEIYHYGKKYETREELEEAIREWIRYYSHERYQRRFGVRTPYEVSAKLYSVRKKDD